MKIVLAGTPWVALPIFKALSNTEHEVVGVVTRPPARKGRSKRLIASPVGKWAKEIGFNLLETSKPGSPEALAWFRDTGAQLGVIVAYGALLKKPVLEVFPKGWINLHFSALPKLRGAAPVQRAILMGNDSNQCFGTTVFQLDEGMDSGDILSVEKHVLPVGCTSGEALEQLAAASATQVVAAVKSISDGVAQFFPQDTGVNDSKVTFAPKMLKEDAFIDFHDSPQATSNRIRAVTPEPGAWTTFRSHTFKLGPIRVLTEPSGNTLGEGQIRVEKDRVLVGCRGGTIQLRQVAPSGKTWMTAQAWSRGARLTPFDSFGEQL